MKKYITNLTPEQQKALLEGKSKSEVKRITVQLKARAEALKADRERQLAEKPDR